MKINSRYTIITIFMTIALFFAIDKIDKKNIMNIRTISGDEKEIDNISFESNGISYMHKKINIDKGLVKESEAIAKNIFTKNYYMNIESGKDSISYVGIDDVREEGKINLVIRERPKNKDLKILSAQGKDKYQYLNYNDIISSEKTEIELKNDRRYKNTDTRILSSIRYKDELILSIRYNNGYSINNIEIVSINTKDKKIKEIDKIDIRDYVSKKLGDTYERFKYTKHISTFYSHKIKNDMYFFIQARSENEESGINEKDNGSRMFVMKYNTEGKEVSISQIETQVGYNVNDVTFSNDKLEVILTDINFNIDPLRENVKLKVLNYNLSTLKIDENYNIDIKKVIDYKNISKDLDLLNKGDKIYAYSNERTSTSMLPSAKILYAIDKNKKEIVYTGKIISNIDILNFIKE